MSNVNAIMLNVTFKQKKPNRIEQNGKAHSKQHFSIILHHTFTTMQCSLCFVFVFLFSPAFPLGFVHCSLFHSSHHRCREVVNRFFLSFSFMHITSLTVSIMCFLENKEIMKKQFLHPAKLLSCLYFH